MIQCKDCEYFKRSEDGEISVSCDPFSTIKEPECLAKWQLIKINQMVASNQQMVASYQATVDYYRKFAPMQEKMFKVMERELGDIDESDKWKVEDDEDMPETDEQDPPKSNW